MYLRGSYLFWFPSARSIPLYLYGEIISLTPVVYINANLVTLLAADYAHINAVVNSGVIRENLDLSNWHGHWTGTAQVCA